MPVPNALVRVINKDGKVVPFQISRIRDGIAKAIMNVENKSSWEAQDRASKYAELVRNQVYQTFYDIDYLASYFSRVISSFDPEERVERMERREFATRLVTLFCFHLQDGKPLNTVAAVPKEDVFKKVQSYFQKHISDSELCLLVSGTFAKKVLQRADSKFDDTDQYPHREFVQDAIEETLKEIGEINLSEGYMIFREGKMKAKTGEIAESQFTRDGIHREVVQKTLHWNIQNECDSVFALNDWVLGKGHKSFKDLMQLADARFYDDIAQTCEKVIERADSVKVVIIAGPSCSNKTTATAIMAQELSKHGLRLKQLNVDDYFLNLSQQPKDEFGDYDFEMPEAIDIGILNKNLGELIQNGVTEKPLFDFKSGQRKGYEEFRADSDEIILIDCLHGLYKMLTDAVPTNKKFRVYIESANMIRNTDGSYTKWTDIRLAKRMVRDSLYRGTDIKTTLAHWAYVRKGELKHIVPYIYSVDAVLNSGLPYELPILKAQLKDSLPDSDYLKQLREDGRLDAYARGIRLKSLFDTIIPFDDIGSTSKLSPIREFIGGSGYEIAHND